MSKLLAAMRSLSIAVLIAVAGCQDRPAEPSFPTSGAEPPYEAETWSLAPFPDGWEEWLPEQRAAWLSGTEAGKTFHRRYRIQVGNNCYNYACNKRNEPPADNPNGDMPGPAQPGRGGGFAPPNGWCKYDSEGRQSATTADDPARALCPQDVTCAVLKEAARKDGLVETDCAKACAAGTYKKALAIDPLTAAERADAKADSDQTDYHWMRQDAVGSWSSKPGEDKPENQAPGDSSGAGKGGAIKDPTKPASWGSYTEFCGCFCCGGPNVRKAAATAQLASATAAPPGPLLAQEPPRPLPAPSGVVVTALIFSGRPNPRWVIGDAALLAGLSDRLDVRGLRPAAKPDWPSLGPRGFLVTTEDPALLRAGALPPILRVHRGVIALGERYYLDDRGLEAWIAANWPGGAPGAR